MLRSTHKLGFNASDANSDVSWWRKIALLVRSQNGDLADLDSEANIHEVEKHTSTWIFRIFLLGSSLAGPRYLP